MTSAFHESVKTHFPEHTVATEPNELSKHSGYCWFIEPLCGEDNFLRSLPDYCAVIGIFQDNLLQHAVVFHYLEDMEFHATKNEGALVNQGRLRVSNTSSLNRAVIALGRQDIVPSFVKFKDKLHSHDLNLRCSGCVALDLARVAQGKLDASICLGVNQTIPLVANLLVTEAGGLTTSASQYEELSLAGNPQVYTALESML